MIQILLISTSILILTEGCSPKPVDLRVGTKSAEMKRMRAPLAIVEPGAKLKTSSFAVNWTTWSNADNYTLGLTLDKDSRRILRTSVG